MEDVDRAVQTLLSSLSTILRYFSSGFAAVLVVMWLFPDARGLLAQDWRVPLTLAMLLGPAAYAIHTAIAVRPLWYLMVQTHLKQRHSRTCKKTDRPAVNEENSLLDMERWLRRASDDAKVKAIQGEMDKWGTAHNYLFCLSYAMFIAATGSLIKVGGAANTPLVHKLLILAGSFVCFGGACWSDYRAAGREMELVHRYPQSDRAKDALSRA